MTLFNHAASIKNTRINNIHGLHRHVFCNAGVMWGVICAFSSVKCIQYTPKLRRLHIALGWIHTLQKCDYTLLLLRLLMVTQSNDCQCKSSCIRSPLQRSSTNIKTALRKSTDKIPLPLMTTQHFWYQCLGRESCILLGFPRIQCISTVVIGSSHLSVKSPQAGAIQLPDTHPLEKRARSHITQDKPPLKTSSTYTWLKIKSAHVLSCSYFAALHYAFKSLLILPYVKTGGRKNKKHT